MRVAPSFTDFERVSEPFIKGAKYYVTVKHPNTGNLRDVRLYNDTEYAKAYGKKLVDVDQGFDNLKEVRGFAQGPILAIRGNKPKDEEWLINSDARYACGVGWHFVSTDTVPLDAPSHFKYIALGWEEFKDGDDKHQKDPASIADIINKKLCEGKDIITFQGGDAA